MTALPPARDLLGEELVRAAETRHRRRQARVRAARIAGEVGLVVATVALAISAVAHRPARADARVELRGGRVVLTLVDLEHDPHTIEAALARAGVYADVHTVPVGPSLVGRFVGYDREGHLPLGLEVSGPEATTAGCSYAAVSVPAGWPGRVELRVGRPARAHEAYAAFPDAFAPGEPFAGLDLLGRSLREADRALAGTDLRVDAELTDTGAAAVVPLGAASRGDHGGWVVVSATVTAPDRVLLRAAPAGHEPLPARAC